MEWLMIVVVMGKDSNNRILLKRWMVIEMRWKRKADSLSSPETEEMRRPRVLMISTAELNNKIYEAP